MKCTIEINEDREEEIIIYAKKRSRLIDKLEDLATQDDFELTGYRETASKILELSEIYFFTTEDNKVFAVTEKEKWQLKTRLYKIEENLPSSFIKINQSCIANIKKIDHFDTKFSGAMAVIFKNGETDYISRRQLKLIKERLGL